LGSFSNYVGTLKFLTTFFPTVKVVLLVLTKNGLGYTTLGDFLSNSSGHPALRQPEDKNGQIHLTFVFLI
jgi:hypothetical protein